MSEEMVKCLKQAEHYLNLMDENFYYSEGNYVECLKWIKKAQSIAKKWKEKL